MTSSTRERLIWSGTTRRICSAARRPRITVSEWMRQAVAEVYHQHLGLPVEWTPEQQDRFIDLKTARLDSQAFDLAMDLGQAAIQEWARQHGQHPDYLTTVGLHETARENAREAIVREQLYDTIPVPDEDEPTESTPPLVTGIPWQDRWMDPRYWVEASDQLMDLVRQVWSEERWTAMFRAMAGYLVATRLDEGLPIPTGPRDALVETLTPQVNNALAKIGYPAE